MAKSTIEKYYTYRNTIKWWLKCSGLWPNYKKDSLFFLVFKRFLMAYWFVSGLLLFCFTFACGIKSFESSNVIEISKAFGLSLAILGVLVRIVVMTLKEKKFKSFINGLTKDFHENMKIPEYQPFLFSSFGVLYRISSYLKYAGLLTFAPMFISTFSSLINGKYVTMFPVSVPWDWTLGGFRYYAVLTIEVSHAISGWLVIIGVDMSLGLCTLYYTGELNLLAHKFQNLKIKKNYLDDLKPLVDRHCELIKYQHMLEEIYSSILLFVIIVCTLNLCIAIYQATMMSAFGLIRGIFFVLWFSVKFSQSFFYAYVGDTVTENNEDCINAMYETEWAGKDNKPYEKDMIIVLSQRPLQFKATAMMYVDLTVFSMIVNTAISYYFLLKTLEEKNADV